MARKPAPNFSTPKAAPVAKTEVRNTPVPRAAAPATAASKPQKQVTQEMIARRAYEIWQSGRGGSDFENWVRAERELRA